MFYSYFIFLVSLINLISSSQSNPGHLKPFGTVGSLINIEEINKEYPDVLKLFTYYIPKSEPVVSRQVLIKDIHYNIWETDEQLENEVNELSKTNIYVGSFKQQQQQRIQMKFGDFLDKYQKDHLFFADNIPKILHKYLVVPRPLQCDAVLPTLQSAFLVVNGINTSPLMFNEEFDSLVCLLRGNKRIVLVNTNKYPDVLQIVAPTNRKSRGPPVNPERVDFNQFPALANVEYHVTNLTAGDCLFIPSSCIFQDRSLDNTISAIYNIHNKRALDTDLNEVQTCATSTTYDASFTLDQIDWTALENEPQNLEEVMMNLINSKTNSFEKWQETFSKHLSFDLASDPEVSAVFDEFYGIVDVDGNGEVTVAEIQQIDGAHQHHISDILYEMVKLVNNKQKTNTPKPVNSDNEDTKETLENDDEDTDEELHLQNYKTDL